MQLSTKPNNGLGFNPRARDGRENIRRMDFVRTLVSIHAPVMDAKSAYRFARLVACFNPRARDGRES